MKNFLLAISFILIGLSACKKVHYEWEDYTYTAVPIVTIDTTKTASPTVTRQTAKVSFFNLKDANLASEQFSFALNWQGFGLATVSSIEVYTSFNKAEPSVPAYLIVISSPGNQYPNIAQFPLPSLVGTNDKLLETVTTFPKTYTYTAAQLATLNGVALNSAVVNDYFLFKFILNLTDGRRIVTFFNNICDESRGEPGDCRTGVRFKSL